MNNINTKRQCRKCKENIPNRIKIDGIVKNLGGRKFCLKCSPYKLHNTHPTDPGKKGRRHSKESRRQQILSLYKRGLERKLKLIHNAGGKCKICGYSKCRRALSFHHRCSKEKLFGLSINELWGRSWEKIEKEVEKCDLLCFNCHMEIENQDSEIIQAVNAKYGTNF